MFSVFKQARKIMFDYLIFSIIYVAFLPLVVSLAKDNISKWTPVYSLIVGLLLCLVIWSDVYDFGRKEKKPMYKLDPSPHKGLLIGFIGMAPYYILTGAVFIFTNTMAEKLNFTPELTNVINNLFLTPVYFIVSLLGSGFFAYIFALIFVPVIVYLGYLSGHKGYTKNIIIRSIKAIYKKEQK